MEPKNAFRHGQVYRLTRDVQNPSPDRRGRNFQRTSLRPYEWASKMEVWPKGMRFRCAERKLDLTENDSRVYLELENFDGELHTAIQPTMANPKWDGKGSPHPRVVMNPKWDALAVALELEPESFDTLMADIADDSNAGSGWAWDILRALYEQGAITKEQISATFTDLRAKD